MERYLKVFSLTMSALVMPKTYSAASLISKVTTNTSSVIPTFPPTSMAKAPLVEIRPDLNMLTTMKVNADELCVMAPENIPQAHPENLFPVHRFAIMRSR